jgi:hypothetical protein
LVGNLFHALGIQHLRHELVAIPALAAGELLDVGWQKSLGHDAISFELK